MKQPTVAHQLARHATLARPARLGRSGFTILELLVVIGIIVVLIGILIPVVSRVRLSARAADSKNQISVIQGAIERYFGDFHAYPGPLPNSEVGVATTITGIVPNAGGASGTITGAENLVLGLCGGLYNNAGVFTYDKTRVGDGPTSLYLQQPRSYEAYIGTTDLSEGAYQDGPDFANDTNVPEFLDRFSNKMPILYLRANVGMPGVINTNNNNAQYNLAHITGYTTTNIGVGKTPNKGMYKGAVPSPIKHGLQTVVNTAVLGPKSDGNYVYPFNAYPYFQNPNQAGQARAKDGYILISAGVDRIYGTEDDITTFGSVLP